MIDLLTPEDAFSKIAPLMREHRVSKNFTQMALSERSGVSLSVLKKFEHSGRISLESFVKLTFVLGLSSRVLDALKPQAEFSSMDELLAEGAKPKRKYAYSPRKKKDENS